MLEESDGETATRSTVNEEGDTSIAGMMEDSINKSAVTCDGSVSFCVQV